MSTGHTAPTVNLAGGLDVSPRPGNTYWDLLAAKLAEEVKEEGNNHTLDVTIYSSIWAYRFARIDSPYNIRQSLHSLWYTFFLAARNYEVDNPKQDILVKYMLYIRECGNSATKEKDTAPNGHIIWYNLPHLAEDFHKLWFEQRAGMSMADRCRLSSFTAKLASVGVRGHEFSVFALLDFRDALETPGRASAEADSDVYSDLVHNWLQEASDKLYHLSLMSFSAFEAVSDTSDIIVPGKLALDAGVTSPGFSLTRWRYWKDAVKTFRDITNESSAEIMQSFGFDSC